MNNIITAEIEYANNSNIKKEDIEQLVQWIKKQDHLPELSEHVLILFYRCCDYSLKQSKDLIDFHYKYRNEAPEFFNGRDYEAPKYQHSYFDITYFADMKNCTPDGCRMIYTGLRDFDPTKYSFTISINMVIRTLFTIELEQGSCPGYVFIWNMTGTAPGHLTSASLQLLRKFTTYIQEGVPLKVRKLHIINVSPLLSKILMLVRPFMGKQLFDLITIHNNMESFYKEIPKTLLPKDLGGIQAVSLDELNEQTRDRVNINWKLVSEEISLRADKSKYKDVSRNESSSMTSSFKKLCLD